MPGDCSYSGFMQLLSDRFNETTRRGTDCYTHNFSSSTWPPYLFHLIKPPSQLFHPNYVYGSLKVVPIYRQQNPLRVHAKQLTRRGLPSQRLSANKYWLGQPDATMTFKPLLMHNRRLYPQACQHTESMSAVFF